MPNQDPHTDHFELISRYLSGNANAAEVQQLEQWVLESPENKAQFIAFKKAWMLSGMQADASPIDLEKHWKQTADQLFKSEKVVALKPRHNRSVWLRIAAGIALLIAASIWIFQSLQGDQVLLVETTDEIKQFQLPDNSAITLNQASSLAYTEPGEDPKRKVILTGDAYFDVARDTAHPFVIQAAELEIEVLGTSFYVDARSKENEIQVIVEEGSVAVRFEDQEQILVAGDKVTFQKQTKDLEKSDNLDPNFQSIKTDTLIFQESSIEEIAFALERHYHVEVSLLLEDTSNCEYSTSAPFVDQPLAFILELLADTWEIKIENSDSIVIMSGIGCK